MAGKKRQKKGRARPYKNGRLTMVTAGIIAVVTTVLLGFISIPLALLSVGIFSLVGMIEAEISRREFWEQAASFKFKTLKDGQDALAKEMKASKAEIDALKENSAKKEVPVPEKKEAQERDVLVLDVPVDVPGNPGRAALPLGLDTKPLPRSPRAVKPQKIPEAETVEISGDEDYESVSDNIVRELVHHALAEKRVDVFIQPIVRLPQRQVRFYEMFARIRARPGQYLPAGRYMAVAEQDNLDGEIDSLLLLHCLKTIQGSAHLKRPAPFFINVKNSTLKNAIFMKRLLGFVSKNRALAPRLVFEIRQSDFDAMAPALLEIMRGLGRLGCSFSLDHVETLNLDIADLQHFKIRFVKFAAEKLNAGWSGKDLSALHRAKRKLEANGIGVIVERIESEEQMRELLDYDIHYGQGYLFGKPELEGAYMERVRQQRGIAGGDAA
ncbi:MAG: EAL domain-containing protein [Alphaproteobacteria bacterium]